MARKIFVMILAVMTLIFSSCGQNQSNEKLIADGIKYFNDKNYSEAITCYEQALEISPDDAVALGLLGEVYNEVGDYDKAIEYLKKSVDLDSKLAPALSLLGEAYAAKGEYDKALSNCLQANKLAPDDAKVWRRLGLVYGLKENYDEAIECLSHAIDLDPKDDYACQLLGIAYYQKGNFEKAMEYTKKAVDLNPKNAAALRNFGLLYYEKGDTQRALNYLEEAVKVSSGFAAAWNNLGSIYEKLGRSQEAAEAYDRAAKLNPNNEDYQKNREQGFFVSPSIENYIDWNKVPKIDNKKDFVTYINNCKKNMQTIIPVVLTNGLSVDWNEFLNLNLTNLASYKVMDTDGKNTCMIYEVKDYPGTRVAYAYINHNTQGLSTDEMQLYNLAEKIVEEANKQPNAISKELYIHDEIAKRTTYYTEENMNNMPRFVTAIGTLLDGKANCQGYADAFYMLAKMCGLNAGRMGGLGNGEPHMWNTIDLGDGKVYCVDVAWDDGKVDFGNGTVCNLYAYFNAPVEIMQIDHTWQTEYAPDLQQTVDDHYFYPASGSYARTVEEGLQYLAKKIGTENQQLARVMCPYEQAYSDVNTASNRLKDILTSTTNYRGNFILNFIHPQNGKYSYYTILDMR